MQRPKKAQWKLHVISFYTSVENLASAIYEDPVREEIIIELNKQMMDDRAITMDELQERMELQNATVTITENTVEIKPKKAETTQTHACQGSRFPGERCPRH